MKIDWFTVIAQVINFIILVWLLKRFLYKPILNALDAREKKINDQLADAENKKAEAKFERDEFIRKNENFDADKQQLMEEAVTETKAERERLLKEARNDADALKKKQLATLKELQNNLIEEFEQNVQREVFSVSKKVLADIASINLEEQAVNNFIEQLSALKETERNQFIQSFKSGENHVLVQSAFNLAPALQHKIEIAIDNLLGTATAFDFKVKPDLIAGIEITANGYKLAWSISEYLDSLIKNVDETESEKLKSITKKESNAKS
ncbi:MAG: F0F1 ATP synthase subunit B [Lutibacter sp.]|nr:F0F1 ATP synthase subunit B [Lutibacter sp.]